MLANRRRWLWITGVLSFVLLVILAGLDQRMQDAGGWGIIDFELAGTRDQARDILGDWGGDGKDAARLSLWLDFAYLALYGAFLFLAASAVRDVARDRGWRRLGNVGGLVAPLPIGAAAFDALEDVALLLALGNRGGAVAPALGLLFASGKFLLLTVTVVFILVGLARMLRDRSRKAAMVIAGGLVLLAVLVVVNAVIVDGETEAADRSAPGKIIELPGGDLHVIDQGPRSDTAIVLIPGFTLSTASWDRAAPTLATVHRVVRFDLLGHGASEKPADGYGMQEQATLVLQALRRLGVRRAVVVGHSMGGSVAVATAGADRQTVRGVMTIGTPPDERADNGPGMFRLITIPLLGQALKRISPRPLIRDGIEQTAVAEGSSIPDRWVDDFRGMNRASLTESAEGYLDFSQEQPLDERMADAQIPYFALYGSEDPAARAVAHWGRVRDAQTRTIPGSGHTPQWEKPAQTVRLIDAFARRALGDER